MVGPTYEKTVVLKRVFPQLSFLWDVSKPYIVVSFSQFRNSGGTYWTYILEKV